MGARRSTLFTGAAIALTALTAGVAFAAGGRSGGPDYTYAGGEPFANATAVVQVTPRGNESALIMLQVKGVDADAGRTFGAHVHTAPCGVLASDAGGHYQHAGLSTELPLVDREVWLDVTIDDDGNGVAVAIRPWTVASTPSRSVIIHADPTNATTGAAGARLACIDIDT